MAASTPGKIDRSEFHRLARAGKTNREIARFFGVSDSAISQYKKTHKTATTKAVVLKHADKLASADLDILTKTSQQERRLLAAAEKSWKLVCGDPQELKNAKNIRDSLQRTQFADPAVVYLKAIQQLTDLLKVKKDIMTSLFDVECAASFQRQIMEIIAGVSPDLRREIINRLRQNQALATSLRIPRPPKV